MQKSNGNMKGAMPKALSEIYVKLEDQVSLLHGLYSQFRQLFGVSKGRVDLLNEMASCFFWFVNHAFLREIVLSLCRLTDPAKQGEHENVSICQLLTMAEGECDSECMDALSERIQGIVHQCDRFRKWRNRVFAHSDKPTLLRYSQEPLPGLELRHIEEALENLRNILNAFQGRFESTETDFDIILEGEAENVVLCLRQAKAYQACEREAFRQGLVCS